MNLIHRKDYYVRCLMGIGDLVVINLLFFLVYVVLGDYYTRMLTLNIRVVILLLNFSYFLSLYFVPQKVHHSAIFLDKIVRNAVTLVTIMLFLFSLSMLFLNIGDVLATFIVVFYLTCIVLFSCWKVLERILLKWYRRKGFDYKRVLIVGAGKNGLEIAHVMRDDLSYGYQIIGFFDDNAACSTNPDYLGTTDQVEPYLRNHMVDEIYCTLPGTSDEKIADLFNSAAKHMVRFYIVPEFYRKFKKTLTLDVLETIPLLSIKSEPLQQPYNRLFKRLFDVFFSVCVLLTIFPPLYVIVGCLIKLSSPGPIIFKQKRTGLYGRAFKCYKFRTMRENPEADTVQAIRNDSRTTKVGRFLRRTNLDEIPQFMNVLKGDMSVVGPRPHMLKQTEQYSALIDKYMIRHWIKPGITGWAQISGFRGETRTLEEMEGRVKRDVWYMENWSFILDLKIIVVTLLHLFRKDDKAY